MNPLEQAFVRAQQASTAGDDRESERAYREILSLSGDSYPDVHHKLANLLHKREAFAEACSHLERALELNPEYTEAAMALAITYNDLGRFAEANALLTNLSARKETSPETLVRHKIANLHADVAHAYRSASLLGEAAVEYRRALGLAPDFLDVRRKLAQTLAEQGEHEEAAEHFHLILNEQPNNAQICLELALVYIQLNNRAEARSLLESISEHESHYSRASAYLEMLEPLPQDD